MFTKKKEFIMNAIIKKRLIILFPIVLFAYFLTFSEDESITKTEIAIAEKLIGINFTESERDSMLDDLNDNLQDYIKIRNVYLDNSVMPSLLFNPIPQNFNFSDSQKQLKFSDYSYTELPSNKDELAFYSVGELAELIKTKQISSVELTMFFLERLKKYDPALHCVITLTEKRALKQAKLMDEELASGKYRGLLHGIPFGVKDLLATKDYKTTWGAEPYKEQMINKDAAVI